MGVGNWQLGVEVVHRQSPHVQKAVAHDLSGTFPPLAAITGRMQDAASSPDPDTIESKVGDIDLMRRTAAGDRDAFATLYQTHHATVEPATDTKAFENATPAAYDLSTATGKRGKGR